MGCRLICSAWLGAFALWMSLCGASHAELMGGTVNHAAEDAWPYANPPWDLGLESIYFFLGLHPINGTHPPDNVQDPSVTFSNAPNSIPSTFAISRYSSSPWGPWDQILVVQFGSHVNNGPPEPRITQAFASAIPPTLPSYPLHVPHRLGRFEWTSKSTGGKDLKVYYPGSTTPVLSIQGLRVVPGVAYPVTENTFPSLGIDTSSVQSVVSSYNPLGTVTGHVKLIAKYQGTGGVSLYSAFETLEGALNLEGAFINVGAYVGNGTVRLTADPYPSK